VGFEPTISAGERPQTYALDRAATGTGGYFHARTHTHTFAHARAHARARTRAHTHTHTHTRVLGVRRIHFNDTLSIKIYIDKYGRLGTSRLPTDHARGHY